MHVADTLVPARAHPGIVISPKAVYTMPYSIAFVDLDFAFTRCIEMILSQSGYHAEYFPGTQVQQLHNSDRSSTKSQAYVSPANSLLYMDGGVDKAYSEVMFPGIRHCLQEVAKRVCNTNKIGQSYLKIGAALAMEVAVSNAWLIAAPTMWTPQDVSGTHNAYHATRAALVCADAIPDLQRLVIPAMCCGYGKMSAAEAAKQVCAAILQHPDPPFSTGFRPSRFSVHGCRCLYFCSAPEPEEEQPQVYANLDFRGAHTAGQIMQTQASTGQDTS